MPRHPKGSDEAKAYMQLLRDKRNKKGSDKVNDTVIKPRLRLIKGSDEAKAYMKALREKRNKK